MTIRFADVEPSPDAFAAVMATGILSISAHNHGYGLISDTMGVIATVGLLFLVALVIAKAATPGQSLRWDLTDPDVTLRLITFVAACTVIDTRLSSNVSVARVLGVVCLVSWFMLILFSSRNMLAHRWTECATASTAHGNWAAWEPPVWRSSSPGRPGRPATTGGWRWPWPDGWRRCPSTA